MKKFVKKNFRDEKSLIDKIEKNIRNINIYPNNKVIIREFYKLQVKIQAFLNDFLVTIVANALILSKKFSNFLVVFQRKLVNK